MHFRVLPVEAVAVAMLDDIVEVNPNDFEGVT